MGQVKSYQIDNLKERARGELAERRRRPSGKEGGNSRVVVDKQGRLFF